MLEPAHLGTWEESKLYLTHELNRMANAMEAMATSQQEMLSQMSTDQGARDQRERDQQRRAKITGGMWGAIVSLIIAAGGWIASLWKGH